MKIACFKNKQLKYLRRAGVARREAVVCCDNLRICVAADLTYTQAHTHARAHT